MFFYFMHFPLPIVVGFFFWVRSPRPLPAVHRRRLLLMALPRSSRISSGHRLAPGISSRRALAAVKRTVHKILNETVDKLWGPDYWVSPLYTHLNPKQVRRLSHLARRPFRRSRLSMRGEGYRWLAVGLIAWTARWR